MDTLKQKAKAMLERGDVQAVIGFGEGTSGARRPLFVRKPAQADLLVFDEQCTQNLAAYVTKPEVKQLGRLALVANGGAQRALLQLLAERQIKDGEVVALVVDGSEVEELRSAAALEARVALEAQAMPEPDRELIAMLSGMTREERWAFWQKELRRCVKCYACRSGCPLCYCGQCTMDCNRPQWVPVASHALGNLEYHLVRAMHLAGRCVACGACGRSCPMGIPVHLLAFFSEDSTARQFGQKAGLSARLDYAFGTFHPEDKESFIR